MITQYNSLLYSNIYAGGPGGAPRPIELQAHDPLRYVGDMLAWVHQALPAEREAAQALFGKCTNIGDYITYNFPYVI